MEELIVWCIGVQCRVRGRWDETAASKELTGFFAALVLLIGIGVVHGA